MEEPSLKSPPNYRKNVKHLTLQTTNLVPIIEKSEKSEELIMSSRLEDQHEKNEPKDSPMKSWKVNNFLELKINDNTELRTPTSSQRLSAANEDKIYDLFELVLNLERMKNYSFYFPHNNAEIIVHHIQMISSRSIKLRKKTFHRRKLGNSKNSTGIPVVQSENLIKLM